MATATCPFNIITIDEMTRVVISAQEAWLRLLAIELANCESKFTLCQNHHIWSHFSDTNRENRVRWPFLFEIFSFSVCSFFSSHSLSCWCCYLVGFIIWLPFMKPGQWLWADVFDEAIWNGTHTSIDFHDCIWFNQNLVYSARFDIQPMVGAFNTPNMIYHFNGECHFLRRNCTHFSNLIKNS